MNSYTYSEARQQLSAVLDSSKRTGKVLIKRQDGSVFSLVPEMQLKSPLDIKGINTDISTDEIVSFVRESREA